MEIKIIPRNYGSIGHLSTSKLTQQADKKVAPGQEAILTQKARDWRDLVIITEKVDGSNVGVLRANGGIVPITRAGYRAESSPHVQHRAFHRWAIDNRHLFSALPEGWRICGEWCLQAHGTLMDISEEYPFLAFDIITDKEERLPYLHFTRACYSAGVASVPLLHIGQPCSIKNAEKLLGNGHYGNPEKPEGLVYRVERDGKVDFLAKWVRHDKEDGKYLDDEIWNTGALRFLEGIK
jgi:hypothetical protein